MISKQFFCCFWSIVCVLGLNGVTDAKVSRDIAQQAFPSVVMLVMEDDNGQPLSLGSGFFVREDIVATNLHVMEGAAGGYAKIVGKKQKYDITGYVAIDRKMDLVLLKINNVKAPAITLGDSSKIAVGDEIFAVGNPQGLEGTFSRGIVSAIRKIEEDTLLQITAPISPGSSGGPILNSEGDVIGISVATFKGGQNLNFAIPVLYLTKLLSDLKPLKKFEEKNQTEKKAKSILHDLGGRNTEGVMGYKFTWDSYIQSGEYSFSLRNRFREAVKNIYCLVVFYDTDDSPIDFDMITYSDIIPAGLAKRLKGQVEGITEQLNSPPLGGFHGAHPSWNPPRTPRSRVEFRILDFQIMEARGDEF